MSSELLECPKCKGDKHVRVLADPQKRPVWLRCDCFFEGVLKRRLGPLYDLPPNQSEVLDGLVGEDVTLIGNHKEWMPYIAGMVRRTPENFKFRVISGYEILKIFFMEKPPEDAVRPDTLDRDHWLVVYLEATPDTRQIGEILFHLRERRRLLRRPTWFIAHKPPEVLRNMYGKSPALAELVDSLPKFRLHEGSVQALEGRKGTYLQSNVPTTPAPEITDIAVKASYFRGGAPPPAAETTSWGDDSVLGVES
jgi:hypothetical protein